MLVAPVRRRRRELALLKTFGFVRRQLEAAVARQSGIAVLNGGVIGNVLGCVLWILFSYEIDEVLVASVPGLVNVLIVVGTLVLANVVATVSGRMAAGTSSALVLRQGLGRASVAAR
jgi:predicted lysophospholipase L1 biosynthesis ABC-type transport system permease subunit